MAVLVQTNANHRNADNSNPRRIGVFGAIILCVALLGIAGCKTTGSTSGKVEYSIFFSPGDHVEQLLAEGKLKQASEVYGEQKEYFSEDSKYKNGVRSKLWNRVKESLSPDLAQATSRIEAIKWPAKPEEWEAVRSEIGEASTLVARVEGYAVMAENKFPFPAFNEFKDRIGNVEGRIRGEAETLFASYEVTRKPSFF